MAINNVVQRGSRVYAYDEVGDELFNKAGELVRYTSDAVFVRRGNRVCQLDIYGYVVDGNVKEETQQVDNLVGLLFMFAGMFYGLFWILRFSLRHYRITLAIIVILLGCAWVAGLFSNPKQPHQAQAVSFVKEYENRANTFHDAMGLFTAQNYKQAKERFEWLAQIKYRPAFSSYMAGQCAYKEEHYQEAIKFYEQSLKIKEQATYTDILLENLANAYKALKDEKHYIHYKHLLDQQKTGGQ
ncbi:tetratricopeptide repeat protein [Helicobacter ailurogastricus]|uniref:TPR repeat containing exported protein Putative periplasmic protein contains a protein prenylyltransferase domain n=2 Tax=Helicobacter ailurogastricus TaxID=1578720 RepID=A0A0K2X5B2_9HELI|nr:hypothetical protein [Helicobacter ailurogastricus]CRF41632.1 TPR repeat containing exported protein; Putative periplasmic protein contains a protein prenylyltransferase domain [Helicobacter ailurogastricus]CRF42624.1 TPR repeat containing exported protein; Putative periplasmic protein contains a protein prenylyltransferase domain [Helicobacter ailurogastricus]